MVYNLDNQEERNLYAMSKEEKENRFVFNADAEKQMVQDLYDNVMQEIERNLKNGIRKTYIRVPVQYSSDVKEMVEKTLFVGDHWFDWKTYKSGNSSYTSETWNGIREYTLEYNGN